MIRHVALVVVMLASMPLVVTAQDAVLTITVPSADVHKGPSTVTPVIGHVSRGKALPVLRNLGSWAKISWPQSPDGVAYLHLTTGTLAEAKPAAAAPAPAATASAATPPRSTPGARTLPTDAASPGMPAGVGRHERTVIRDAQGAAITHMLGIGGMFGPASRFGGTARAWRDDRFGVQVNVTRAATNDAADAGRLTSVAFEPAVVYTLFDRVGSYVWLRPYVGSGVSLRRQTLSTAPGVVADRASANSLGLRLFGGGEFTFAGAPRLAVSLDLGYRRYSSTFAGLDSDRFGAALSGHWYMR